MVAHPKVTAVIPAHNMASYIERALGSALGQTYSNLDILVIDDGSDDDTARIARRIADEHPHVRVVTTENAGVAAARNLGTQMADSLYVAYLDADDLWHPLKIEKQVEALAAHGHSPAWGSCYTLHRMIDSFDIVLDDAPSSHERGDFFEEHLVWNPVGNGSNLLVRRDLALAVGGFNSEYAKAGIGGCEDLEFQLKLLRRSKMELVREFLVGYRLHTAQMSSDIVMMRLSKLAVIKNIVGDEGLAEEVRERALVQAYLTLAKGYFLVRDWRAAAKSVAASFAVDRIETTRKFGRFFRREFGYWGVQLKRLLQPPATKGEPLRSFAAFGPCERLDVRTRHKLGYRSSLTRQAEARSSRQPQAVQGPASQNPIN
uniref:glycosyltransferase family 2 protein n=1 Tax=Altererythrobacter segetis TaxID=1104773 RepID=UPI0024340D95|nr:glycosyltransferase family 2 protein [Altererythrobacter segetis]